MKFLVPAVLLSLLLSAPAHADEVEVGSALICDTRQQVEHLVSFMRGDVQSAVNAVNAAEHNQTACGMSSLAFLRGSNLATVRTKEEPFRSSKFSWSVWSRKGACARSSRTFISPSSRWRRGVPDPERPQS